jgi:hypothetical protein
LAQYEKKFDTLLHWIKSIKGILVLKFLIRRIIAKMCAIFSEISKPCSREEIEILFHGGNTPTRFAGWNQNIVHTKIMAFNLSISSITRGLSPSGIALSFDGFG